MLVEETGVEDMEGMTWVPFLGLVTSFVDEVKEEEVTKGDDDEDKAKTGEGDRCDFHSSEEKDDELSFEVTGKDDVRLAIICLFLVILGEDDSTPCFFLRKD